MYPYKEDRKWYVSVYMSEPLNVLDGYVPVYRLEKFSE